MSHLQSRLEIKVVNVIIYTYSTKHDWFKSFFLSKKSLSEVFGRKELYKKGSRNKYIFFT